MSEPSIDSAFQKIVARRLITHSTRALLVGISGIDGSGKGFVAARLERRLKGLGLQAATINVDGWLTVPTIRFARDNQGEHFYHNALRLDELFSRLVWPLREQRTLAIEYDHVEETARRPKRKAASWQNIDVILLEGIFIFKSKCQSCFDFRIWIDCGYETALRRAIARGQEGLSRAATIEAYQKIYFPAQEIHRMIDEPEKCADLIVHNDFPLSSPNKSIERMVHYSAGESVPTFR